MCDGNYTVLMWNEPPFVSFEGENMTVDGFLFETFMQAFGACCERLPNFKFETFSNQAEVMSHLKDSAIAMPISVTSQMLAQENGMFIRVLDAPGLSLVVKERNHDLSLFVDVAPVWPVLAFAAIITGYGALFLWLIEKFFWKNHPDISPNFVPGFFESYWLAFISATSVGYGDSVPKSNAAKVFMMVWILAGIGTLSVFTASITTILTREQAEVSESPELHAGDRIGVLNGTLARQLVIQAGSFPVESSNISYLHQLLEHNEITGILLNSYYCMHISGEMADHFQMLHRQAAPVVIGVMFPLHGIEADSLRTCIKQHVFIHALEHDHQLIQHIEHEAVVGTRRGSTLGDGIATTIPFIITIGVALVVILIVAGVADYFSRRYKLAKQDKAADCVCSATKVPLNGHSI